MFILYLIKLLIDIFCIHLSSVDGRLPLNVKLEVEEDGVYADGLSKTVLFRDELNRSNPLGLLDEELELDM